MVFVKVRETYDLKTTKNKMSVIGIHTPNPTILKVNYPGLLMQCRAYRPVSCDVVLACASVMPLDPLGVGTDAGQVSPEDLFNPILYKAISNKGMSQLEARINAIAHYNQSAEILGNTAAVEVSDTTPQADEFSIYYGLLSNTHEWRHANPQAGLQMKDLKPYVYDVVANVGDQIRAHVDGLNDLEYSAPAESTGNAQAYAVQHIIGKAKEMPFINCTSYSIAPTEDPSVYTGVAQAGFPGAPIVNSSTDVPWLNCVVGAIIVPPSRQHVLYYRFTVEWLIEFSKLRPLGEIMNWVDLGFLGDSTHYQNYSYSKTKEVLTGDSSTIMENDTCMVSANVDINKVM